MYICLVVEDVLSEYTVRKILSEVRPDLTVKTVYKNGGFGYIKSNVKRFWKASQQIPFVVLADLDNEICAPSRVLNWLGFIPCTGRFVFRIAVHETESWLMADRGSFSDFLGISERLVPKDPDILLDPKEKLLKVIRDRLHFLKIGSSFRRSASRFFVLGQGDDSRAFGLQPVMKKTALIGNSLLVL